MPTRYSLGQTVMVTKESFQNVVNGNRSIYAHPCCSFVEKLRHYIGQSGKVTMTFLPGYDVNVTFDDGKTFQLTDHWVEGVQC